MILENIPQPDLDFNSAVTALEITLQLEREVNKSLLNLHKSAFFFFLCLFCFYSLSLPFALPSLLFLSLFTLSAFPLYSHSLLFALSSLPSKTLTPVSSRGEPERPTDV